MSMTRHSIRRLGWTAPGERHWEPRGPAARLAARADDGDAEERKACGESVTPREVTTRRLPPRIDIGKPAPLLMRLARQPMSLDPTRVSRKAVAEPRQRGIEKAPPFGEALQEALEERRDLIPGSPLKGFTHGLEPRLRPKRRG